MPIMNTADTMSFWIGGAGQGGRVTPHRNDIGVSPGLIVFAVLVALAKVFSVVPFKAMSWWVVIAPAISMPVILLALRVFGMVTYFLGSIPQAVRRYAADVGHRLVRAAETLMSMSFR